MPTTRAISRAGCELEGGWNTAPVDGENGTRHTDSSVSCDDWPGGWASQAALTRWIGEYVSPLVYGPPSGAYENALISSGA